MELIKIVALVALITLLNIALKISLEIAMKIALENVAEVVLEIFYWKNLKLLVMDFFKRSLLKINSFLSFLPS